jgi:hypothetical protein
MKTQNNIRFEKVLNIQGKAMRVNLPFGMQSSDYPEPERCRKVEKELDEVVSPKLRRHRQRAGRKRAHRNNAEKQRAYRDRRRSLVLRNRLVGT